MELDKVHMIGWTEDMEFRISTAAEWTACTEVATVFEVPLAKATYYVRFKGESLTVPASSNKTLSLSARGSAPSVTLSYPNESLTGMRNTASMVPLGWTWKAPA